MYHYEETPLIKLFTHNDGNDNSWLLDSAKRIVNSGVNLNAIHKGYTALGHFLKIDFRCDDSALELIKLLIYAGTNASFGLESAAVVFNSKRRYGYYKHNIFMLLVNESNVDPETLVIEAWRKGNPLSSLILCGATCNSLDNPFLRIYENCPSDQWVQMLSHAIENGLYLHHTYHNGMTSLMMVATLKYGYRAMGPILEKVDPLARDNDGKTALVLAIENKTPIRFDGGGASLISVGVDEEGDALVASMRRTLRDCSGMEVFERILELSKPDSRHCSDVKEILDFVQMFSYGERTNYVKHIALLMKPIMARNNWRLLRERIILQSATQYWRMISYNHESKLFARLVNFFLSFQGVDFESMRGDVAERIIFDFKLNKLKM